MIIHEIIVKEKLKQNSTIAGHYLQSASKPNVSSLVVFGIKKKMKLEDVEFCTDGLLRRSSKESHTRLITIVSSRARKTTERLESVRYSASSGFVA